MTTLREAAEAVMEQLKHGWVEERDPVAQDLKAALAEPVQEPVAWRTKNATPPGGYVVFQQYPSAVADLGGEIEPLYTAPGRQRKPLTEEEAAKACGASGNLGPLMQIVRAVERAHGIGDSNGR